jgi:hypothetical protein
MKIVEIVDAAMQPSWVLKANNSPPGKNCHGLGISIHHVLGHLASVVRHNEQHGEELLPYVNLGDARNLFYQPELGLNIWNYWFCPIVPPNLNLEHDVVEPINYSGMNHWPNWKLELGRRAWKRYVKLEQNLQESVNRAYDLVGDNALAVHIRGTDKWREITGQTPALWIGEIRKHLESDMPADKIFLATDDPTYAASLKAEFKDRLVVLPVVRSGFPLHYIPPIPVYHTGFQALTEAFVAARCPYLIRGQSNFTSIILLAGSQKKVGLVGQLWDGGDEKWDKVSAT